MLMQSSKRSYQLAPNLLCCSFIILFIQIQCNILKMRNSKTKYLPHHTLQKVKFNFKAGIHNLKHVDMHQIKRYQTCQVRLSNSCTKDIRHTKSNSSFKILETFRNTSLGQYSHGLPGLITMSAKHISCFFSLDQKMHTKHDYYVSAIETIMAGKIKI